MHLARLLTVGSPQPLRSVAVIISLAALGNAALIGLINHVAETVAVREEIGPRMVLLYLAIFAFYYIASRASLKEANRVLQDRLAGLRLRVVGKIRNTPLRSLEQIGHGHLFAAVAQEINQLAHNLPIFVAAAQSAFLLAFVLLYIAVLSVPSFLVLVACVALGGSLFWRRRIALNRALAQIYDREAAMMETMGAFVEGFQEIRLNADKNDGLYRHFNEGLDDLEGAVVGVGSRWVSLLQFSNAFVYALVGVVIFVLPLFFHGYDDTIYKIAAAATFCIGPVTSIIGASHLSAKAEIGLGHVHDLEAKLDRAAVAPGPPVAVSRYAGFSRIEYRDITFSYRTPDDETVFATGPWTFSLNRGEIVFFTGGNGSGKTTVMKLLSLLYTPDAGAILVDGRPVTPEARQDFREMFAAIFHDFHLFDRLYGLDDVAPEVVQAQIAEMELADKVAFEAGRFSTLDLSTGQRKRLALIVSRLEDREIYLFDEWAADQDSHFRDTFYRRILPDLKRRGKTVIAVTHDDRYWDCCDRRIRLSLGAMEDTADEAAGGGGGGPTWP
ncbi:cyclic peptide export ABC transporter [Roseospira navarrensis]|uniref:Cyclic peptide export ABC transporter n=1 Tax=Roseospira navarrensis TaxID=140058 RepID=A0A7X1ZE26_9PROT|nr:cyclic peptide export ABC transporter [Roseospira navarrensis]MQX35702.1 cyclic peptide export ABC transporter [Roseospira navarrensis]